MASDPLLEFAELLQPIPGDLEAGEPVPYELRQELDEDRKEIDPSNWAEDDPTRPEQPKWADWSGIVRKSKEILRTTSKDLLIAARLTEALTRLHGFAGARDGFHLLGQLVDQCWDRLNPPIEDGDIEVRAAPFTWLDEFDRGARFPATLGQVPLIVGPEGKFGWMDWRVYQDPKAKPAVPKEVFDKAVQATPAAYCQERLEEITQALQELRTLISNLDARMGPLAPGLTNIGQALEGCRGLTKSMLDSKGGPAAPAAAAPAADGAATAVDGAAAAGPGRPAASRSEAYRQLEQAASLLQQLEPHSPVPYLVRKAVELGTLPFPELMRRLIRDANVLTELNRELGIKSEAAPPQEGYS
jgi:type VI secretion system protein ImpA